MLFAIVDFLLIWKLSSIPFLKIRSFQVGALLLVFAIAIIVNESKIIFLLKVLLSSHRNWDSWNITVACNMYIQQSATQRFILKFKYVY